MNPGICGVTVIGVGNPFRHDDGVGPATVARLRDHVLPGVTLTVVDGEPTGLMDAWTGAELAVVVDAVVCDPPVPGRIHRISATDVLSGTFPATSAVATHGLVVADAVRLATALDRLPRRLVVLGVEAADVSVGPGLTQPVAAAVPGLVSAVLAELDASARR